MTLKLNLKLDLSFILIALFIANTADCLAEDNNIPTKTLENMLQAIQHGSREAFLKDANEDMKQALTAETFDKAVATYKPLLKYKYTLTYLGSLRKNGYTVYLYRMRLNDVVNLDDFLTSLSMKDRMIGGLVIN